MSAIAHADSETIAARAGWFLGIAYMGAHKDKRIARALQISPAMAKALRNGRGWTVSRLDQAAAIWPTFAEYVFPRSGDVQDKLDLVLERIDALQAELREFTRHGDRGVDQETTRIRRPAIRVAG